MEGDMFVNKVAASGILTVDLMDYKPTVASFFMDIKDFMYMGLIIREKEFKEALSQYDWSALQGRSVAVGCSEEGVIPTWAYMLLANYLLAVAETVDYDTAANLDLKRWKDAIMKADFSPLTGKKVVVRARPNLDPALYMLMTLRLQPIVKTLLYGEAGMPKVIAKNG